MFRIICVSAVVWFAGAVLTGTALAQLDGDRTDYRFPVDGLRQQFGRWTKADAATFLDGLTASELP
jgi:hypothetical protein